MKAHPKICNRARYLNSLEDLENENKQYTVYKKNNPDLKLCIIILETACFQMPNMPASGIANPYQPKGRIKGLTTQCHQTLFPTLGLVM